MVTPTSFTGEAFYKASFRSIGMGCGQSVVELNNDVASPQNPEDKELDRDPIAGKTSASTANGSLQALDRVNDVPSAAELFTYRFSAVTPRTSSILCTGGALAVSLRHIVSAARGRLNPALRLLQQLGRLAQKDIGPAQCAEKFLNFDVYSAKAVSRRIASGCFG